MPQIPDWKQESYGGQVSAGGFTMAVGWPSLSLGGLRILSHNGSVDMRVQRWVFQYVVYVFQESILFHAQFHPSALQDWAGEEEEEGQVLSHFSASDDRPVDTHA